jgi:hypothetical protein
MGSTQTSPLEKTDEMAAMLSPQKCTLKATPELETNKKNAKSKAMCF